MLFKKKKKDFPIASKAHLTNSVTGTDLDVCPLFTSLFIPLHQCRDAKPRKCIHLLGQECSSDGGFQWGYGVVEESEGQKLHKPFFFLIDCSAPKVQAVTLASLDSLIRKT